MRLKQRIKIQKQAIRKNRDGTTKRYWITLKNCEAVPAEVLTGAGREQNINAVEHAITTARITTRWLPLERQNIASYRIVWSGYKYNITSVSSDPTDRVWLRFECVDGVGDGE